ncbi:hypothetical protein COT72_00635 [archaeon CG10_big_fil_rev_8_21_14_0_10_43_11]|nr:MAG: hypothetical protein COT72_00635 [archaeon CG10_big_fil_rev_8_21_14_0_10_43_11]
MKVLKAKKETAEKTRQKLLERGALDKRFRIRADASFVYFAVKKGVNISGLGNVVHSALEAREKKTKHAPDRKGVVARAHDVVGDIVVLESEKNARELKDVAQQYLDFYKSAKTVVAKSTKTSGEFRVRHVRHVAGEKKTKTLHKENGCVFFVDLNTVFYTPRLSGERKRILEQVKNGERVVDMFSGVGPYIIPIAKFRNVEAYANDKNPDAYKLLVENAAKNKVSIACSNKDAENLAIKNADRILMNLPKDSEAFLDAAFKMSKNGTVVHFYHFSGEEDLFETQKKQIIKKAKEYGFSVKFLREAKAGEIGIRQYRVVIDFQLF